MKLSVIIVSYNVCYYLEQCLLSVFKATQGLEVEVFVVDNHSQDHSVEYLRERFGQQIILIESQHNVGFARANNLAIRQASGEYVLLLNPDTIVGERTIRKVLDFMDLHAEAGGAGVTMYNTNGTRAPESRRALPTPFVSFMKMMGFSSRYYMSHLSWDEPARIDIVSGAFCLLRRQALDQIGLLDEDFFMYGEDIDLSYRLLKGGFQNWYIPSPIIHYKGESTQKSSFRYVHVFYQAMLIFFRKHYEHLSWLVALPIKVAIYLRALVALVSMQSGRLKRFLGFAEKVQMPFYTFYGSQDMLESARKLVARKGLCAAFASNCEEIDIEKTDYLVYDTSMFSYDEIMTDLASYEGRITMGTYSAEHGMLITPKDVIL